MRAVRAANIDYHQHDGPDHLVFVVKGAVDAQNLGFVPDLPATKFETPAARCRHPKRWSQPLSGLLCIDISLVPSSSLWFSKALARRRQGPGRSDGGQPAGPCLLSTQKRPDTETAHHSTLGAREKPFNLRDEGLALKPMPSNPPPPQDWAAGLNAFLRAGLDDFAARPGWNKARTRSLPPPRRPLLARNRRDDDAGGSGRGLDHLFGCAEPKR